MTGRREDEHTEFKEIVTKEMMKSVVAFSNTRGGHILVGVRDDGSVAGLEDPDKSGCQVGQLISDHVRPDISGSVSIMPDESSGILDVMVPEGLEKPYYLRDKGPKEGGVYIRQGPASVPAKDPLIRKMFRERMFTSYESMVSPIQDLTFEDTARFFSDSGLDLGRPQMRTLHMLDGESYTNLGYLLSDQCTRGIKVAVYEDEFKTEFIDRAEFTGSVLTQVASAMSFVEKHNRLRSRISGIRREDSWKFPTVAIREVLMNAVVHREYSINGDILVSVYGERISMVSPGGLPSDVDIDDLKFGLSIPRNPNLASVFYRLRLVEEYGTGIPRVMSEYRKNAVKPLFEAGTNVFSVILPALDFTYDLPETGARIMSMVNERGGVTRLEVELELGMSKTKAYQELSSLTEDGLLTKVGCGRSTRYVMKGQ